MEVIAGTRRSLIGVGYSRSDRLGKMTHMDTLTLEIPREIAQALRLPPQDRESRLRLELAVALYSQNILGGGKAADLAGLPLLRFNEELDSRRVPMHYDESDLAQDAAYGRAR